MGSEYTGTLSGFGELKWFLWFAFLFGGIHSREVVCCLCRAELTLSHVWVYWTCSGVWRAKVFLQKQSRKSQAYTTLPPNISCFAPNHKKYKMYFLRCIDFYVRFSEKAQGLTLQVTSQRIDNSSLALESMCPPSPPPQHIARSTCLRTHRTSNTSSLC